MTIAARRPPEVDLDHLTAEQEVVATRVAATRGRVPGPFTALLNVPQLADHVQRLGAHLRFDGDLDRDLAETAVLIVAHRWRSRYVWDAHEPIARREGVATDLIDCLEAGETPAALPARYRVVHDFARELASSGRVDDALYTATVAQLGLEHTIELTVLVAYYSLIAMTLNGLGWS